MPELPEVETTVRGLNGLIPGQDICEMRIYDDRLRWPVDHSIVEKVFNTKIGTLVRRSKYILMPVYKQKKCLGHVMIHLGMSGRLQVVPQGTPREKHSHLEWLLSCGNILRYTDPRRFGSAHWVEPDLTHALLDKLGPEPLTKEFTSQLLFKRSRNRQQAIKVFIMNAQIVVGVGNIYANEALFRSAIHPQTPAGTITQEQTKKLVQQIKLTLKKAIKAGGTTLRDFQGSEGKPGYFKQELLVYGREGEPCTQCDALIECIKLGQRATYFCAQCQT